MKKYPFIITGKKLKLECLKKGEQEKILYGGVIQKTNECESRPTGVK